MGQQVTLVSSAEETAKDVLRVLTENDLLAAPKTVPEHEFRATGEPDRFARMAARFLGPALVADAVRPLIVSSSIA